MTVASNLYRDRMLPKIQRTIKHYEELTAMTLRLLTGREWRWSGTEWEEVQQPEPDPYALAFRGYRYEAIRAYEEFGDGVFEPGEDPAPGIPF